MRHLTVAAMVLAAFFGRMFVHGYVAEREVSNLVIIAEKGSEATCKVTPPDTCEIIYID